MLSNHIVFIRDIYTENYVYFSFCHVLEISLNLLFKFILETKPICYVKRFLASNIYCLDLFEKLCCSCQF